jgi:2-iminobutanoate/2-iminopropanoate deaminase
MKMIQTDDAPQAIGPYSQGIKVDSGQMVFTAGQLGIDPQSGAFVSDDIAEQTAQALKNMQSVLLAAGADLSKVAKTTVFLKNISDFQAMNAVYAQFFSQHRPARSAVEAANLPKDALIEIEAIAVF